MSQTRMNFNITRSVDHDSNVVNVSIKPPQNYYQIKLFRRIANGSYMIFATIDNAISGTTYNANWQIGNNGGEFEIYVRAQISYNQTAEHIDYAYANVFPETGTGQTSPLTQNQVDAFYAGKFLVHTYISRKIAGLVRPVVYSRYAFGGAMLTSIKDPLGIAYKDLTGWVQPQVGDYYKYTLSINRTINYSTYTVLEYKANITLWRKNANGVYQEHQSEVETFNFTQFVNRYS